MEKNEYPAIVKIFIIVFFILSLGYFLSQWIPLNILAPILAVTAILLTVLVAIYDRKRSIIKK